MGFSPKTCRETWNSGKWQNDVQFRSTVSQNQQLSSHFLHIQNRIWPKDHVVSTRASNCITCLRYPEKKLLSRYEILSNSIICIVLLVIIQIDRLAKSATFISFPSYAKPHMTQRSCGFNQSLELRHILEISRKKTSFISEISRQVLLKIFGKSVDARQTGIRTL